MTEKIEKDVLRKTVDAQLQHPPSDQELTKSGVTKYQHMSYKMAPLASTVEQKFIRNNIDHQLAENPREMVEKEISAKHNSSYLKLSNSIAPVAPVIERKLKEDQVEVSLSHRPNRNELETKGILKPQEIVLPENEAPWILIQVKSFVRWVNLRLVRKGYAPICDIMNDFSSGYKLAELLNASINAPLPRFKKTGLKKTGSVQAKLLNLDRMNLVFNILRKEINHLGVLKPEDITEGKLKYKLSLVWRIILEFNKRNLSEEDTNLEKAIYLWLNRIVKSYEGLEGGVTKLGKDLRDGLALGAILHYFDNSAISYNDLLRSKQAGSLTNIQRLTEVFNLAEERFGITKLLDPEDLDTDSPDEKSIITYLGEWLQAFTTKHRKKKAVEAIKNFVRIQSELDNLVGYYKENAYEFADFCKSQMEKFSETASVGKTNSETKNELKKFESYFLNERTKYASQFIILSSKYLELVSLAKINERKLPEISESILPPQLQVLSKSLTEAEFAHLKRINDKLSSYIKKEETEETDEHKLRFEIENAFHTFDHDRNGLLNLLEFNGALQALGLLQEEKVFLKLREKEEGVSLDKFMTYCLEKLSIKDNKKGLEDSFKLLAGISEQGRINREKLVECLEGHESGFLDNHIVSVNGMMHYKDYLDKVFR